jgi:hypothetical protein
MLNCAILNTFIILSISGDHYVVETDGLLIRKVTEADDGVYVCRAIVLDTGELQERHINVEVGLTSLTTSILLLLYLFISTGIHLTIMYNI